MQRISIIPRNNWQKQVEEKGFTFHSLDNIYWDESTYYSFSMDQILYLEKVTAELWDMCLKAVQHVIDNDRFDEFKIPKKFKPYIINTWFEEAPAIYGRFDFSYDGKTAKLLEFNADTPTSLFEASVIQWFWLQDFDKTKDQFNSIHEKLVAYWQFLKPYLNRGKLHFASVDTDEDIVTTLYMQDCAIQACLDTKYLKISDIGWDNDQYQFVDMENEKIVNLFKLYPWEWLVHEEFGENILKNQSQLCWVEPAWKMLLSNKALLPILWELFPNHENLLGAWFTKPTDLKDYAEKPILSREGSNIKLVRNNETLENSDGVYGQDGYIYQELALLPEFDGNYPLIGSWVIGQEPAGMGIRESKNLITGNTSRFVPHLIV